MQNNLHPFGQPIRRAPPALFFGAEQLPHGQLVRQSLCWISADQRKQLGRHCSPEPNSQLTLSSGLTSRTSPNGLDFEPKQSGELLMVVCVLSVAN